MLTMESLYRAAILVGLLALLLSMERFVPLRKPRHALARRLFVNLSLSALAVVTAVAVVAPAAGSMLQRVADQQLGLIHWTQLPPMGQFIVGFVGSDLLFYYWHMANHKIPLLWRFHNVHHIDPDLDVSTAFRFHFGEVALSAGFRVVQIGVIGLSPLTFAIYELAFQANTLFHHSNVRLPIRIERILNGFLVTPRMHGIHHSEVQREDNSNFSVVFPWWDLLHRTLRLNIPQSEIVIGMPAYMARADNMVGNALAMPFRSQREYWRNPDGTIAARTQTEVMGALSSMQA